MPFNQEIQTQLQKSQGWEGGLAPARALTPTIETLRPSSKITPSSINALSELVLGHLNDA
jgi:hypothetical protein